MGWNGVCGFVLLFIGFQILVDAPIQALRDRCHDWKNEQTAKEELAACNQLLADHPNENRSDVLASRGSAHYRLGDYGRAGVDYAAAIRIDPKDGSSYYNLGLVRELLGDRESAIVDYGAAIRIDPKNADAFMNRGLIFLNTRKFERAIADFSSAHDLRPTDVKPLADRGLAYAWKGDWARAEQDFATVKRSDPSNLAVLHGEGVLAITRGDMVGGVRLLSAAIDRNPGDAWAFRMRATVYGRLGEHEKMQADVATAQQLRKSESQNH